MSVANLIAGCSLAVAFGAIFLTYREWLRKTSHWLCIPAPNVRRQNPTKPTFWVFPPVNVNGTYAVAIAGELFNAGPSDAFSVRVYAKDEASDGSLFEAALKQAADVACQNDPATRNTVLEALTDIHRDRSCYDPILKAGEHMRFLVVATYEESDPYLTMLRKEDRDARAWEQELVSRGDQPSPRSLYWALNDRQAHPVHASARTPLGRRRDFSPADLCAPFEKSAA